MTGSKGPILATVIPIYNESRYIIKSLDSLINQTLDSSKHLIVVLDGGSTDDSVKLVQKAIQNSKDSNGPEIILLDNPNKHVAEARNIALEQLPSSVNLIVELIGHCTVPKDHLAKRLEVWEQISTKSNKEIGGLGVRVLPSDEDKTMVETWIEASLSSGLGSGSGQFDNFSETSETRTPAFCMHLRSAVKKVGGWDSDFITSQDSDLSMRLLDAGFTLYRTNETHVNMVKRTNYSSWVKMGYRYGFWRTKILKKHPSRISKREFLPWLGLMITIGMYIFCKDFWYIPPLLYGVVILIEGLRFSIMWRKLSLLLGVPISLMTLHTTFSLGLLSGLFRRGKTSRDR